LIYEPEQIYLYPLYIRPLTGLGRQGSGSDAADIRVELYRQAREFLIENGYRQSSMRMFERLHRTSFSRPVYCCQDDGMVGIGCGARSYTSSHHYSMRYAVGQKSIRDILQVYVNASADSFSFADYGFLLNDEEQKRRFVIQSLLQLDGLSFDEYYSRFNQVLLLDFSNELNELLNLKLVETVEGRMYLTETGLEWSDRIGFELYSAEVKAKMESYENR
jgi:oxygen-independent coproporphyrinogen-3 oxidase